MKTTTLILAGTALFAVSAASATAGPCALEIENVTKTLAAKDAGSGPTAGAAGATQSAAGRSDQQHPPTSVMSQETEGKATSPEDVRRQTAGQPTATQQGTTGAAPATGNTMDASGALDRARMLDQQGKEAECMEAVREAKRLAGPDQAK